MPSLGRELPPRIYDTYRVARGRLFARCLPLRSLDYEQGVKQGGRRPRGNVPLTFSPLVLWLEECYVSIILESELCVELI